MSAAVAIVLVPRICKFVFLTVLEYYRNICKSWHSNTWTNVFPPWILSEYNVCKFCYLCYVLYRSWFLFLHGIYMSLFVFHISLSFYICIWHTYTVYSWMAPNSLHVSLFINLIIPLSFSFVLYILYLYFCILCFHFDFQIR